MKKLAPLALYLFFSFQITQIVAQNTCFYFDDSLLATLQNRENAVDLFRGAGQPLQGWSSVNGSPSVVKNFGGVNTPSGTQCLVLAACGSNRSEGVSYNYTFKSGKNYQVSFKYRYISIQASNAAINTFDVLIADSLLHNNQGGCGTINTRAVSPQSVNILSKTNYSDTAWQTATLNVSNLGRDYSQIWWRINIPQAIVAAPYLLLDDVCIQEIPTATCFYFDDTILATLQNRENAVDLFRGAGQPLQGWSSVNGSPSVVKNFGGVNTPSGTQCLVLAACGSNRSEGVSYNYTFKSGKNYQVSFKYRYISIQASNAAINTFDVLIADSLLHNNQGGCGTINTRAVSPQSVNILSKTNYSDTAWQTATLNVSNLGRDYSQIWWRVNIPQAIVAAPYLLLDDVCIQETNITGVKELNKNADEWILYPNPATNFVNIQLGPESKISLSSVQVFNMLGKEIRNIETRISDDKIQLETAGIQAGNYIVKVTNNASQIFTKRLVITK